MPQIGVTTPSGHNLYLDDQGYLVIDGTRVINATGTGKAYGEFYSTNNQTASSATTAYAIELANTAYSSGVTSDGVHTITVATPGLYRITTVYQFANTNQANTYNATFWLAQNGSLVANSASQESVGPGHGGSIIGGAVSTDSYLLRCAAGDTLIFYWQSENSAVSMEAIPAGATPVTPASASATVSINQVST